MRSLSEQRAARGRPRASRADRPSRLPVARRRHGARGAVGEARVRGERRIARAADGRRSTRCVRRLERLTRKRSRRRPRRASSARASAPSAPSAQPLEGARRPRAPPLSRRRQEGALPRRGSRRARHPPWKTRAEREKAVQEALGRWNDLRMFCRRLRESRDEAEERGAVTLPPELGRLLATLEPTIAEVRRAAVEASRQTTSALRARRRSREPASGAERGPRGRG